jgi:hypothetical protein
MGKAIGHGYLTHRVLYYTAGMVVVGAIVFGLAFDRSCLTYVGPKETSGEPFNSVMYSLDSLVPLVDFHVESKWYPNGTGGASTAVRYYFWFHIFSGWVLSTLAVIGISRLVREEHG